MRMKFLFSAHSLVDDDDEAKRTSVMTLMPSFAWINFDWIYFNSLSGSIPYGAARVP